MKKDVMLLIGGIVLISGIVIRGVMGKDTPVSPNTAGTVPTQNSGPSEVIAVGHDGWSLVPEQIVLAAGKSYDIQVTPSRNGIGCMFAATVPTLSSEVWNVKAGEMFSIKVDNAKPGTYPVVCTSMGMKQGVIVVQPAPTGVVAPTADEYRLITIEAKRRAYTPSTITIKKGEKIKIKIIDVDTVHGVNFQGISATKDAEGNFIIDTSNAGTFSFSCASYCGEGHREMKGQIIIS